MDPNLNCCYDLKRNSFVSYDDACAMAGLLSQETGLRYEVNPDTLLGFTATRCLSHEQAHCVEPPREGMISERRLEEYRPSWRGFIPNYLLTVAGLTLLLYPVEFLEYLFPKIGILEVPDWLNPEELIRGLAKLGWGLTLLGQTCFYRYFAHSLQFNQYGVLYKKGVFVQDQVMIRYADIKSIAVKQGLIETILGIGSLHLDSAATNGDVDIVFKHVKTPNQVRERILQLIDAGARIQR